MKKLLRSISFIMMLVMCFSATAFAAETNELKVTFKEEGMTNTVGDETRDKITPKAPAAPVSGVQVVASNIKSDGYVYVTVQVTGYGKNIYTTYDGMQCEVASSSPIGRPIVTGFLYEVKCAKAVVGAHNFTFRITSSNSPWNTMSTSATITVK